jgi:hypothetical protein
MISRPIFCFRVCTSAAAAAALATVHMCDLAQCHCALYTVLGVIALASSSSRRTATEKKRSSNNRRKDSVADLTPHWYTLIT